MWFCVVWVGRWIFVGFFPPRSVPYHIALVVGGRVIAVRGLQVWPLWKKVRGSAPDPPQDTAVPTSNASGASGKMYLAKGSVRNRPANTKIREGENLLQAEETIQGHVDVLWMICSPWPAHVGAGSSDRSCSPRRGPLLEQGKSMRKEEWQRGTVMDWL